MSDAPEFPRLPEEHYDGKTVLFILFSTPARPRENFEPTITTCVARA